MVQHDLDVCFVPKADIGGINVIRVTMIYGRYLYGIRRRQV